MLLRDDSKQGLHKLKLNHTDPFAPLLLDRDGVPAPDRLNECGEYTAWYPQDEWTPVELFQQTMPLGCRGAGDRSVVWSRAGSDLLAGGSAGMLGEALSGNSLYGRWNYPLGVTLYGLLRTGVALSAPHYTEYATGHIEQCSKWHDYAEWDRKQYGAPGLNHQLSLIDSLDDCGSFGAAMLTAKSCVPYWEWSTRPPISPITSRTYRIVCRMGRSTGLAVPLIS